MKQLHNQPIQAGDKVYDVAMGAGEVMSVTAQSAGIVVRFAGGRQQSYTESGMTPRFAKPTLFWGEPVMVPPDKAASAKWSLVIAATRGMIKELSGSNGR